MKHLFYFYAMLALSVLVFSGCNKDCPDPANPDCDNYDPCLNPEDPEPADASFEMLIYPYYYWNCVKDDTVFLADTILNRNVHFRANQEEGPNVMYEWWFEGESIIRTPKREISLYLGPEPLGDFFIRLKVEKTDTSDCDGISRSTDISTQFVHVKGWPESIEDGERFPVLGRWEGYNEDNPDNRYVVETALHYTYAMFPTIRNLIPGYEPSSSMKMGIGQRFFHFHDERGLNAKTVCGIGILEPDHRKLVIEYEYQDAESGEQVSRKFIGTRVE